MKYFSDVTREMYDTVEELQAAEELFLNCSCEDCDDSCVDDCSDCQKCRATCKDCLTDEEKIVEQPSKKMLAAKIEQADLDLKNANAEYAIAKSQVEELSKTYLEAVEKIMGPAKKAVTDAEQAKYRAIKEFNDTFGTYQVTLTGAKAAEELMRAMDRLNNHSSLFKTFGWPTWF